MKFILSSLTTAVVLMLGSHSAIAQTQSTPAAASVASNQIRDPFFWLGEMNKATLVINSEQGLLDKAMAPRLASGVAKVIADGEQPGGKRPSTVISFEPSKISSILTSFGRVF